jgi:tetratricopeptide (TPR) repeat protein
LYGLSLVVRGKDEKSSCPARFEPPQRWVLIDTTPPLLQWDGVDRDEGSARTRSLHLRWTAYDDHFTARPISIQYRVGERGEWRFVERELASLGRYDWVCPAELKGSVTLKLLAKDAAGNQTERTWGPLVLEAAVEATTKPAAATQPVVAAPATRPVERVDTQEAAKARRQAERLYQQGPENLRRGEYAVAAERFREAMETDPGHLAACNDLAGIYYLQRDYGKALELYESVLKRDANHVGSLRGAALVYVAQKQYAPSRQALQKLVTLNKRDAESWLDLGDVLFMMGSQAEARSQWDRAATVDPAAASIIEKARRRLESYGGGSETAASPSAGKVAP